MMCSKEVNVVFVIHFVYNFNVVFKLFQHRFSCYSVLVRPPNDGRNKHYECLNFYIYHPLCTLFLFLIIHKTSSRCESFSHNARLYSVQCLYTVENVATTLRGTRITSLNTHSPAVTNHSASSVTLFRCVCVLSVFVYCTSYFKCVV